MDADPFVGKMSRNQMILYSTALHTCHSVPGDISLYHEPTNKYIDLAKYAFQPDSTVKENTSYLTLKFNSKKLYSWVIIVDPWSFSKEYTPDIIRYIFRISIQNAIKYSPFRKMEYIAVLQDGQHKGLHAHFTVFSNTEFSKTQLSSFQEFWNSINDNLTFEVVHDEAYDDDESWQLVHDLTYTTTYQKIKSSGSYIHYLKNPFKNFFHLIASHNYMWQMFSVFDKDIVFPKGTAPKRAKMITSTEKINSDNSCVLYIINQLNSGVSSFGELMMDSAVQQYLHLTNLRSIWNNCLQNFSVNNTHEKNIQYIFKQINELEIENICCCAVFDWLKIQKIDIVQFVEDFTCFIFKRNNKRNMLLFEGIPNAGKSYFTKNFWELFLLHKRCTNEERFSFSNVPGSGAILWDDPHVSPEIVDIVKQLTEGDNTMEIPIKGQASQLIHSNPIYFINVNKPLWRYCQSERNALLARAYYWRVNTSITDKFCLSNIHHCNRTESVHNPLQAPESSTSTQDNENTDAGISINTDKCNGLHVINRNQALSFILICSQYLYCLDHSAFYGQFKDSINSQYQKLCQTSQNDFDELF